MKLTIDFRKIDTPIACLNFDLTKNYSATSLRDIAEVIRRAANFMDDAVAKPYPLTETTSEKPSEQPFKIKAAKKAPKTMVKVSAEADPLIMEEAKPKPKPKPKAVLEEPLPPKVSKAAPVKTAKPSAPKLPPKAKPRVHTASSLVERLSDPEERGPACEPLAGYSVVPRQENGMPDFQFAHDDLLTNGIKRGRKYSDIAQDLGNSVSVGELKRRYARLNAHNRAAS